MEQLKVNDQNLNLQKSY